MALTVSFDNAYPSFGLQNFSLSLASELAGNGLPASNLTTFLSLTRLALLSPQPTNATNQPLDWTMCKLLIHNGAIL